MAYIVWQLLVTEQICKFSFCHYNDLKTLATDIQIKTSVGNSRKNIPLAAPRQCIVGKSSHHISLDFVDNTPHITLT